MGLMTMLTGKSRFQRQIEKLENTKGEENHDLVLKFRKELNLSTAEEIISATSLLCVCSAINMFLTHHLRTKLSLHPKWTTQSTFDEEGPALVAWLRPHLMVMTSNELAFEKRVPIIGLIMDASDGGPEFRGLIENMFKNADLKRMADNFPEETKQGINVMTALYKSFCVQSSIDSDPDGLLKFFKELRLLFFRNWDVSEGGIFS
tara:strand:+ start:426 stop:1040 length:615 start_codon:yes stop_codon:yes gene_type:complete